MKRGLLIGGLIIGLGAAATTALWPRTPSGAEAPARRVQRLDAPALPPLARVERDDLAQRVERLTAQLAEERTERRRLEERLEAVVTQLASLDGTVATAAPAASHAVVSDEAAVAAPDAGAAAAPPVDYSLSPMERALVAAGIDHATAADMKRRRDALTMQEMYLRDQATREKWVDTPRFSEELAAIQQQQTSVRDEIGDLAYDRYLFAEGRTNRVRVDEVLSDSPAFAVGLQPGDMILSYGETRLFAPDELVAETRSGTPGDTVRLQVVRAGQHFEVDVPRGPLGLRIDAAQDKPAEG